MSNFRTNKIVSQKIASLGVKAESEKGWVDNSEYCEGIGTKVEWLLLDIKTINDDNLEFIPAYSLAELADVLREVGKIKGLKEDIMSGRQWGEEEFITVCQIFVDEGESAANKYLESIL